MSQWKMNDYECSPCSIRFESLEARADTSPKPCPECGAASELVISAPLGFGQFVTVERGQLAKPPGPNFLNTSDYGLRKKSYREWKDARDKQQREQRWKELRKKL